MCRKEHFPRTKKTPPYPLPSPPHAVFLTSSSPHLAFLAFLPLPPRPGLGAYPQGNPAPCTWMSLRAGTFRRLHLELGRRLTPRRRECSHPVALWATPGVAELTPVRRSKTAEEPFCAVPRANCPSRLGNGREREEETGLRWANPHMRGTLGGERRALGWGRLAPTGRKDGDRGLLLRTVDPYGEGTSASTRASGSTSSANPYAWGAKPSFSGCERLGTAPLCAGNRPQP